jgi:glyoxylase-like metal-dependent hydrolase (beta-lactamase superfamily II)
MVSVPDANVVFGGDLVQRATIPNLADAKTDAWVQTLDGLLESFPSATFVPGHGAVARPLDLRALRDYLTGLRLAVAGALRDGKSGMSLSEAVLPQLRGAYGTWTWIEHVQDNVVQTEEELTGRKVFPTAPTP